MRRPPLFIVADDPAQASDLQALLAQAGYDVTGVAQTATVTSAPPPPATRHPTPATVVVDTALARQQEQRFFELSNDMLCFADYSGYFRRLSPAWETTLGFSREELMARPSIEFVHPDDRERTIEQNRHVKAGAHASAFENRYRHKDGTYRWLMWNAAPDLEQQVIYSVARDITRRKQAEADRESLVAELQAALAEVRTLQEFLPICSYCRKVRDDENYWQNVESYVAQHTGTRFSHAICPECYRTEVAPQLDRLRGRS